MSSAIKMNENGNKTGRHTKDGKEVVTEVAAAYKTILAGVGENTAREGLLKTPERAAKALIFFTQGYYDDVQGEHTFQ